MEFCSGKSAGFKMIGLSSLRHHSRRLFPGLNSMCEKSHHRGNQRSDNFQAIMDAIVKAKPSSLKGAYLRSVVLTSTMGPGVKLSTAKYVG